MNVLNTEKEYTTKIESLKNKIEQLEMDIKDNDKEDSKRRNVVIGIICGCFVLHTIGCFISPLVIMAALVGLLVDTIVGWCILSKFENKDFIYTKDKKFNFLKHLLYVYRFEFV